VRRAEIKFDDKTHRLGVVVDGSGVRATLSIEIPDDFPFGHLKARVKFNEDKLEMDQVDILEALEKEASKLTKQSDIAIGDVVEAFIKGMQRPGTDGAATCLPNLHCRCRILYQVPNISSNRCRKEEEETTGCVEDAEPRRIGCPRDSRLRYQAN
jgi:hypothetical protein